MPTRGTSNRNDRGSSYARARRRAWVMKVFASDIEGFVRCYRCGKLLAEDNLTIDRIVPGKNGGTYKRGNIRPACIYCNRDRANVDMGNELTRLAVHVVRHPEVVLDRDATMADLARASPRGR